MSAANITAASRPAAGEDVVLSLRLDSGIEADGARLHSAVEIRIPFTLARPAIALVCLPGGGMNRYFFDLVDGDDASFSFARAMTARGFIVVMIDHLGVGDSDRPADDTLLTPELLAQANAEIVAQVLDGFRNGSLSENLPALPEIRSIGVGHSMGATLTILQQVAQTQHAALCLLGFSTRGLPEYLSPELRALAHDRDATRARLVELAASCFARPPARSAEGGDFFAAAKAEPRGARALRPAIDRMLKLPAFLSMLPGNVAREAAQVRVPVFIGVAEMDITGPSHEIPAAFSGSHDVSLHVLPQAGHSHFIFAARRGLFQRFGQWARATLNQTEF